jgi:hypothetical protein
VPLVRDFNKNGVDRKYRENKETHMPHPFVQWALCFQNAGFKFFFFGLVTVGFLIKRQELLAKGLV